MKIGELRKLPFHPCLFAVLRKYIQCLGSLARCFGNFFPGNLTYFLPIVGQSDLVTDGATNNILNSESTFFYDSNDVYCVLGRIFFRVHWTSGILADNIRIWSVISVSHLERKSICYNILTKWLADRQPVS